MSLNPGFHPRSAPPMSTPRRARRRLRWAILFSVPALLLVSLLLTMQSSPGVDAASANTFAGCSGGSQTPNYPTIQDAVSNTAPSGVVHICTGVYSESVNLALMNEGNGEGNITLVAEDGPGTAQIAPLSGPALHINNLNPFDGNITLEGLDVTSGGSDAVHFGSTFSSIVSGTVTFSGVVAHDAGANGAFVLALGDINVINSQAISNGSIGFLVTPMQNLTVDNSQANFNGTNGIGFSGSGFAMYDYFLPFAQVCPEPVSTALFVNSTANDNGGYGIDAYSYYHHVRIDTVNTHRNAYDGVAAYTSDVCEVGIVVVDSAANGNGFYQGFYPYGGFYLASYVNLLVARSTAEDNLGYGFCLEAYIGPLTMEDSVAQNNGETGVGTGEDACAPFIGPIAPSEPRAAAPGAPALAAAPGFGPTVVMITNTTAFSNGFDGFAFDVGDLITVTNISSLQNAGDGVKLIFEPFFICGKCAPDAPLAPTGVLDEVIPINSTWIKDSLIVDNQAYGVEYQVITETFRGGGGGAPVVSPAAIGDATQFVNNSIICNNIQGGMIISETTPFKGGGPQAPAAPELYTEGVLEVNGTANWWGDNSGPAHPTNPSGTGDAVFDTSNGFTGTVYFNPFIDQIAGAASPNPTLLGIPVNVNFQFSGAAATVFLGQGVGNLNDTPPFTVATNNGTVEGGNPASPALAPAATGPSIEQFIGPANGNLPVVLTPASAGTANVTLEGPCNLVVNTPVLVATPSIVITKTPDLQTIPEGATAAFSITVHNTGDVTLTNVTVTDALASDCDNALGVLGPGVSTVYACEVTPAASFTNVASVSGLPQIDTEQPLQPVTDSDDAQVIVAPLAISLVKTVGAAGSTPSCPAPGTITVEQGAVVEYCYTVTNTGDFTLSTHSLVDDKLGVLMTSQPFELAPGASVSTLDLGLVITTSLQVTTSNVATWTAGVDPLVSTTTSSVTASNAATVNVPPAPTAIDPDDQPLLPRRIFVPNLSR